MIKNQYSRSFESVFLFLVWITLIASSGAVDAQENNTTESDISIQKSVEMYGHRALQRLRQAPDATLHPFVTDGCSGGLSASWTVVSDWFPEFAKAHQKTPPWEVCCIAHDRIYHVGGDSAEPERSFSARLDADEMMRTCVANTSKSRIPDLAERYDMTETEIRSAYAAIANSMYFAVRLGGSPCTGLPWQWGFGYGSCEFFSGTSVD